MGDWLLTGHRSRFLAAGRRPARAPGTRAAARAGRGLRTAFVALAGGLLLSGPPAAPQDVTLEGRKSSIREIFSQLETQTGYEFRLAVGHQIEESRHDFTCRGLPLAQALHRISELFRCDVFSVDSTGFFVIPAQKPAEKEVPVGPYRLRVSQPIPTEEEGVLQLTLVFAAPDDTGMEAVAGLGGELRITDNFGRTLVAPSAPGLRTTSATRVRLTEYWHRLPLALRDSRATRIRNISGSLVLYRRVSPLKFEFPLEGSGPDRPPQEVARQGLSFRLERLESSRNECSVTTRLAWAPERVVVGRGIARTPHPYLVDSRGRVYRDSGIRQSVSRGPEGELLREQTARFEGLQAAPARLVYEVLLKEEPEPSLPFQVSGLPLPEREKPAVRPEQRPFYAASGGQLTFRVTDRAGRAAEGEVALGLSRREEPAGGRWTAWRWIDLLTDPEGRVRLPAVRPGTYRVLRMFRLDPALPPVMSQRSPLEAVVHPGREARLSDLRLPVDLPADR